MATSRLGRFFGRDHDEREADTAPPAYTGVGAPRPYDPPPGAPGAPAPVAAPTRQMPPAPVPRPAPSPHGSVTPAQHEQAGRERRAADQQVGVFERFDAKLTAQIHQATEAERLRLRARAPVAAHRGALAPGGGHAAAQPAGADRGGPRPGPGRADGPRASVTQRRVTQRRVSAPVTQRCVCGTT